MADGVHTKCDFCRNEAYVDGKTSMGPWAFMCRTHFERFGIKTKGLYSILNPVAATKRCSICGKELPISSFYSYYDAAGVLRYRTECKVCNLKRRKK